MNTSSSTRAPTGLVMHPQPSAPDMGWLAGLPHRDYLELAADGTAPRTARRRLATRLSEWSLPEFEIVASVIVSELVTNARAPRCALSYPRCSRDELKGGSWA